MNIPNGNENGCAERMKWCGELSVDIVSQPAKKQTGKASNSCPKKEIQGWVI